MTSAHPFGDTQVLAHGLGQWHRPRRSRSVARAGARERRRLGLDQQPRGVKPIFVTITAADDVEIAAFIRKPQLGTTSHDVECRSDGNR